MAKLLVGSRVIGKSKKHKGKVGVVHAVRKESRQHTYDIRWSNGSLETVAARSLALDAPVTATQPHYDQPTPMQDPVYTTFTNLLRESNASFLAELDASCSSSSDEDDCADDSIDGIDASEIDGSVICHGRRWEPCTSVLFDQGSQVHPRPTRFNLAVLGNSTFAKYFYLMYPLQTLKSTLSNTNRILARQQFRTIAEGDWFKWIGLRLAMAVEPRAGSLRYYWETECQPGFVGTPPNFGGRYGMSRHCFEQILYCMAFSDEPPSDDQWQPIRPIIDVFNERRKNVVFPGNIPCIDECMSAWKGRESKYCADGLPHKTKIARKPEGVGTELKAIADGQSGVLLGLELVEGAARQREKPYAREYGEGTAVVLRLSVPYRGTGRTIVADNAFASVKTLIQLEQRLGLYFMGIVKTATVQYPIRHLREWAESGPERGDFKVLSSTSESGQPMYATCWADRKAKTIIANRGTTLPGTDSVRTRHRLIERNGVVETIRYEKRIKRPQMIELFFDKFSTIDVHDHYRQGSLAIEREWITRNWTHRLFGTSLGMIVVDAFLAHRHDVTCNAAEGPSNIAFHDFVSQLAYQLIHNDYQRTRTLRSDGREEGNDGSNDDTALHKVEPFRSLPQYANACSEGKRIQRLCGVCKKKSSYYCITCSRPEMNEFYGICGPRSGRNCLSEHLVTLG